MLMSQSRALAGCRAMTMVERAPTVKQVSNGSKYFMRKKGSFMVEVRDREAAAAAMWLWTSNSRGNNRAAVAL